jgi:hypothetical protein
MGLRRLHVSFRQGEAKEGRSCLTAGIIRTGQGEKRKKLSEYEYHSDRPRGKRKELSERRYHSDRARQKKQGVV